MNPPSRTEALIHAITMQMAPRTTRYGSAEYNFWRAKAIKAIREIRSQGYHIVPPGSVGHYIFDEDSKSLVLRRCQRARVAESPLSDIA